MQEETNIDFWLHDYDWQHHLMIYINGFGFQKISGIILALIAVYLASVKTKNLFSRNKNMLYPILLFIGSGIIDTSIKYMENFYVHKEDIALFSATIFLMAGFLGLLTLTFQAFVKKFVFDAKSLIGGSFLGIFNYFSIYFLLKALQTEGLESSTIFTLNNVSTVMLTTLFGLLLFKETIYVKNWIGIALAIISISLITLS